MVFVYPVWWADCPAKLKGWFDRVLTVGFAYATAHNTCKTLEKVLFLCTAGNSIERLEEQGVAQSMRVVSLNDRVNTRAKMSKMVILGGRAEGDPAKMEENLQLAFEEGRYF
jgi:NAD(P)H dehydrogenase (quinone)